MPSTRSKASADVAEQVESALAEETKTGETEEVDQVAEDVKSESDSTTILKEEADGGNGVQAKDEKAKNDDDKNADDENSKGEDDEAEEKSKGEKRANEEEEDEVSSAVKQSPVEKKAKLDAASTDKPITESGDSNNEVTVEN